VDISSEINLKSLSVAGSDQGCGQEKTAASSRRSGGADAVSHAGGEFPTTTIFSA